MLYIILLIHTHTYFYVFPSKLHVKPLFWSRLGLYDDITTVNQSSDVTISTYICIYLLCQSMWPGDTSITMYTSTLSSFVMVMGIKWRCVTSRFLMCDFKILNVTSRSWTWQINLESDMVILKSKNYFLYV